MTIDLIAIIRITVPWREAAGLILRSQHREYYYNTSLKACVEDGDSRVFKLIFETTRFFPLPINFTFFPAKMRVLHEKNRTF